MDKLHAPGQQGDAAVRIAPGSAVFQVAFDGTAHRSQLTAYLVMTARHQLHFKQSVVVTVTYHLIF